MLVWDIETNGLLDELTTIHCINMIDRNTGERLRFNNQPEKAGRAPDGTISDGLRRLEEADEIAGHFILGFDIPALQKIYPSFKPKGKVIDTVVYSRVIWTDLKSTDFGKIKARKLPPEFSQRNLVGRHSLEAWGYRLGRLKGDYGVIREAQGKALGLTGPMLVQFVWGEFNPEMDDYCEEDCEVTLGLIELIEKKGYSPEALELEGRVAAIIDQQEKHGFLFDVKAAEAMVADLTATQAELDSKLRRAFKPWYAPVLKGGRMVVKEQTRRVPVRLINGDGELVGKVYGEPGAPYSLVKRVEFSPSSRDHIANRLTTLYGWEPQEWTPGGKPKVDETTLDALAYPEISMLKDYLVISKVLGLLINGDKALLKMVGPDGRIHGRVNSNGAVTGRMTHSDPNVNFPKVKTGPDGAILKGLAGGFGFELRSLVIVPKGKKMVGVDAEGLEDRMLGHYMALHDNGAYIDTVLRGDKKLGTDTHSLTKGIVGLNSRDNAKTWKYAYVYGAGNWKLGFIEYEDMLEAKRATFNSKYPPGPEKVAALTRIGGRGRKKIEEGLPALGALQQGVHRKARTGYLRSLDGRMIRVRGMHSSLNSLLQSGGAVVMKKALVIAYDAFLARGWVWGRDFAFVLNVHDEFQIEAEEHLAEEIGSIAADAIRQAGEAFNLRCPLSGSTDIGNNWAETH